MKKYFTKLFPLGTKEFKPDSWLILHTPHPPPKDIEYHQVAEPHTFPQIGIPVTTVIDDFPGLKLSVSETTAESAIMKLCSRDIQVGDKIQDEGIEGEYFKSDNKFFYIKLKDEQTASIQREQAFKVIGEVSPEATWVKEGDEFDETEWRFRYRNVFSKVFLPFEVEPADEHTNLGDMMKTGKVVTLVQLKCSHCKHFH